MKPVLREAVEKVAPIYPGYDDGPFDWGHLHYWSWFEDQTGAGEQINASFTFRKAQLKVKRVELCADLTCETPTRRWPR